MDARQNQDRTVRRLAPALIAMVVLQTAGLAGCVAMGFGAPIPAWVVGATLVCGTVATVVAVTLLITARVRP